MTSRPTTRAPAAATDRLRVPPRVSSHALRNIRRKRTCSSLHSSPAKSSSRRRRMTTGTVGGKVTLTSIGRPHRQQLPNQLAFAGLIGDPAVQPGGAYLLQNHFEERPRRQSHGHQVVAGDGRAHPPPTCQIVVQGGAPGGVAN